MYNFSFPHEFEILGLQYISTAILVPIQKLSIQKIPRFANLLGLVILSSYVKEYILLQSKSSTLVLHSSSGIIFTRILINFFLINKNIFVSRLAGSQVAFKIPQVFKPSFSLFLILVEIRILIPQYFLSIITNNIF